MDIEINKELEESKIKQMICPECGDRLKEITDNNGKRWLACNNYYCRWEKCIDEQEEK